MSQRILQNTHLLCDSVTIFITFVNLRGHSLSKNGKKNRRFQSKTVLLFLHLRKRNQRRKRKLKVLRVLKLLLRRARNLMRKCQMWLRQRQRLKKKRLNNSTKSK